MFSLITIFFLFKKCWKQKNQRKKKCIKRRTKAQSSIGFHFFCLPYALCTMKNRIRKVNSRNSKGQMCKKTITSSQVSYSNFLRKSQEKTLIVQIILVVVLAMSIRGPFNTNGCKRSPYVNGWKIFLGKRDGITRQLGCNRERL